MLEDPTRPGMGPRVRDDLRGPAPAGPSHTEAIQGLLWLRQQVADRLDALETLARRRETSPDSQEELEARERALRQGTAELEEARRKLRDEAEQRQEEWNNRLAQLDQERRTLAEAWERVERERIEGLASVGGQATPASHARPAGPARGTVGASLHATAMTPPRSPASDPAPFNPVAQAILREFQTLARDVRTNAAARREPSE